MNIFDFLETHKIKYNNKSLVSQAFIHSSYVNEHKKDTSRDNERLEFMGDAVLQIYSAKKLYDIDPPLKEGLMSTRRSNLVCEKMLATIAREFGLNKFLKLGTGEEKNGGRDRDSIIADMVEAFIGAIYLDTNINNVFKLLDIMFEKHIKEIDEKIEIRENGTYEVSIVNKNGKTETKEITIGNIVSGIIGMTPSTTSKVMDKLTLTITWPENSTNGIKEVKVGNKNWEQYTGAETQITIEDNCTVYARVRNTQEEIVANTITITNIVHDTNAPIVTLKSIETVNESEIIDKAIIK